MSDIYCTVCGEPWESYHVRHDMPIWARDLFLAGAGCESCEGRAKSPEHALANAEKAARQQIFCPDDMEGNLHAALDQMDGKPRPKWKRPEDPTVWRCTGCDLQVKRDLDRIKPDPGEDLYLVLSGSPHGYTVDYHREQANEDLIQGSQICPIKVDDHEYCYSCAETCYECGEPMLHGESYSDPHDVYGNRRICEGCLSEWGTCISEDCNEYLQEKDDCGYCSGCAYELRKEIKQEIEDLEDRRDAIQTKLGQGRARDRSRRFVIEGLQVRINKLQAEADSL
jgi:hypothetical protein